MIHYYYYLLDGLALGRLMVADHVLRRAQLDEGEVWGFGDLGGQGSLPAGRRAFQQHGDQRRAVAGACLRDDQVAVLQDAGDGFSPRDDPVGQECVQCFFAAAERLKGQRVFKWFAVWVATDRSSSDWTGTIASYFDNNNHNITELFDFSFTESFLPDHSKLQLSIINCAQNVAVASLDCWLINWLIDCFKSS